MHYKIEWQPRAARQLAGLQRQDAARIFEAVGRLTNRDTWQNVIALKNHAYEYRLRVGNFRVLFDVRDEVKIVDVQEVRRRNEQTY